MLNDPRFQEFTIPIPSKTSKGTKEDKICDVMSFQLQKIEQVFGENEIEVYSTTIQGDYLDAENIVKIEISEDLSEPSFTGRGKNKKRMKVSSIMPSLPFIQEGVTKIAVERLSKIYSDYMNIIKDKKLMSQILEIEETEDDKTLITAFVQQYGDLWLLTNEEKKKALLNRLEERTLAVLDNYISRE